MIWQFHTYSVILCLTPIHLWPSNLPKVSTIISHYHNVWVKKREEDKLGMEAGVGGVEGRRNIWLIFLTRFMCRFFELISRTMPKGDYLPMLLHICSWVILFIHVLYYNAPPAVCSHRTNGKNAIYFPLCTRWRQLIMSPGNMKTAGTGPNSLLFMYGI